MPQGEIHAEELREQDHFRNWNRALHRAIRDAEKGMEVGETAKFTVEVQVSVTRENPGWADGYIVVLKPTP